MLDAQWVKQRFDFPKEQIKYNTSVQSAGEETVCGMKTIFQYLYLFSGLGLTQALGLLFSFNLMAARSR